MGLTPQLACEYYTMEECSGKILQAEACSANVGEHMRIAIGADHGGYLLKQRLIKFLDSQGLVVADMGTHSSQPCDYPIYGIKVAKAVANGEFDRGILICKSGLGMTMTANRIRGVRATLCWDIKGARSSRLHNDANIICLSAKRTSFRLASQMLKVWFDTEFEGGRHARRIKQIDALSK